MYVLGIQPSVAILSSQDCLRLAFFSSFAVMSVSLLWQRISCDYAMGGPFSSMTRLAPLACPREFWTYTGEFFLHGVAFLLKLKSKNSSSRVPDCFRLHAFLCCLPVMSNACVSAVVCIQLVDCLLCSLGRSTIQLKRVDFTSHPHFSLKTCPLLMICVLDSPLMHCPGSTCCFMLVDVCTEEEGGGPVGAFSLFRERIMLKYERITSGWQLHLRCCGPVIERLEQDT